MTRPSHPPTLLTLARRLIACDSLFAPGHRVLVAVSGGPDSMALLHVLASLRAKLGVDLVAHGVDHGLRPEACAELDLAASFAASLGVAFERSVVSVAPGGDMQARARDARYAALEQAAARVGAHRIATGHHADDRAETFLIRLLRGAGPRGLGVLPSIAGKRVRPLLRARRADILAHVRRHDIPHATDPSNENVRFLRTRVRFELVPLMERLSPGIVERLCAVAEDLATEEREVLPELPHIHTLPRAAREAIRQMVRTRSKKTRVRLPGGRIASYDPERLSVMVEHAPSPPAGGEPRDRGRPRSRKTP